jgi:transposase
VKRDDVRTLVRALRDLDRMDGHQPFVEIVQREFKNRSEPSRRCPNCRGPLDGWMMSGRTQVVWCQICTTFDEASAHLSSIIGPAPKQPRRWNFTLGWLYASWDTYEPGYSYRRVLTIQFRAAVFTVGWAE